SAFNANRFNARFIVKTSMNISASGSEITGMESGLINAAQNGGTIVTPPVVVTGSGVTVSLNANTPGAQNIPYNSPVEFLKINLTAANDGAINVSGIKLTAYGLSDATYIDDATFYDNGTKIGTSKDFNSDRVANFNFANPIYVAAGTTKTLTVKATILDTKTGTFGLGIASASDITSTGASVSGSFPVKGNLLTSVEGAIGSLTIDSATASNPVANFGEDNVLLADFTLKADNKEDALIQSISLYNGGTRNNNIVSNLRLVVDGEEIATGNYSNDYATFTLNSYLIEKNDTVNVEVYGDMGITSANDTVKLYLKNTNDLVAVGKTQGFTLNVANTGVGALTSANAITVKLTTGDLTIDANKTATPAKDIKADTTDVVLATLTIQSNGEDATITEIKGDASKAFNITSSDTTNNVLENVELVDKTSGGVYDLEVASSSGRYDLTLSDEISLVKGVAKTFEIRADILKGTAESTTFKVNFAGTAMTVEGEVSGDPITAVTPSAVYGSLITVKTAKLTVTPVVLTDLNVVGGASDIVVYKAMVEAGTADSVKIQSLKLTTADNPTFDDNSITKLDLYLDGKLIKTVSNQINESTDTINFSSLKTADEANIVKAGKEVELVVKATFASTITAGSFNLYIATPTDVSVRAVSDSASVTATTAATPSRKITAVAKGKLTVNMVIDNAKKVNNSFLLAGSQTEADRYLGEIKFITQNEAVKVKTLSLVRSSGADADNQDIKEIKLVKADGTVVATKIAGINAAVTFDPFNVVFSADQTTSLYIVAVAKGVNVDGDSSATARVGKKLQYKLGTVTASGNNSNEEINSTDLVVDTAVDSKIATVVGTKLNSIVNTLSDGKLANGTKTIGEYKFIFDNASNRGSDNDELKATLTNLVIDIAKDATTTLANVKVYVKGDTSKKSSAASVSSSTYTWNTAALTNLKDLDGEVTLVIEADVSAVPERGWLESSITLSAGNVEYDNIDVAGNILSLNEKITGANLAD
ncbi:MAG: hypothetical protein PHC62_09815, partial [Candidatus Izemoplasmatales bacterium]|nr:hypothetical protein [Candidatus Izemoplasmatales bacterium]